MSDIHFLLRILRTNVTFMKLQGKIHFAYKRLSYVLGKVAEKIFGKTFKRFHFQTLSRPGGVVRASSFDTIRFVW